MSFKEQSHPVSGLQGRVESKGWLMQSVHTIMGLKTRLLHQDEYFCADNPTSRSEVIDFYSRSEAVLVSRAHTH